MTLAPGARWRPAGGEDSTTGIAARPRGAGPDSDRVVLVPDWAAERPPWPVAEPRPSPRSPPPDGVPVPPAGARLAAGMGSAAKGAPSGLGETIERSPDMDARSSGRIATISTPSATSRLDRTTASGPSSVRICFSASAGFKAT